MKKVFVIVAGTGEYSDRITWPVIVVEDKELAQRYMKALEEVEKGAWGAKTDYRHTYDAPGKHSAKTAMDGYALVLGEAAERLDGTEDWELADAWA